MSCRAVIFDLDGTLVDTLADLGESMNFALTSLGQPTHKVEEYRQMVGDGTRIFAKRALPENKEALCEQVMRVMLEHYKDNCFVNSRLYKGINETITELRNRAIELAVLTNKDQDLAERIVGHFFKAGTFRYVIGAFDGEPVKPGEEGIRRLIEMMKLAPSEVIIVGDSGVDMDTAAVTGIRAVGVSWGFRSREELIKHKASIVIDKPVELLNLVS